MKTIDFLKSLKDDSPIVEKLKICKSQEEMYEILKAEGVTDTFEEIVSTMNMIKEESSKLSEKEISAVSGGASTTATTATTVTVIPSAVSGAVAAV